MEKPNEFLWMFRESYFSLQVKIVEVHRARLRKSLLGWETDS